MAKQAATTAPQEPKPAAGVIPLAEISNLVFESKGGYFYLDPTHRSGEYLLRPLTGVKNANDPETH